MTRYDEIAAIRSDPGQAFVGDLVWRAVSALPVDLQF
jgi:hypothetical protein